MENNSRDVDQLDQSCSFYFKYSMCVHCCFRGFVIMCYVNLWLPLTVMTYIGLMCLHVLHLS